MDDALETDPVDEPDAGGEVVQVGTYRQLPVPVRLDEVSTLQDTSLSWHPDRNWIAGVGDGGAIGGLDEGGDGD